MPTPLSTPRTSYASSTIAALTATEVGTLTGRYTILIQNLDSANLFVGFDALVTNANGVAILPNGSLSLDVSLNPLPQNQYPAPPGPLTPGTLAAPPPLAGQVWVYSVAGTASNAVRVLEVA